MGFEGSNKGALCSEGADHTVRAVRRQPGVHNICSH